MEALAKLSSLAADVTLWAYAFKGSSDIPLEFFELLDEPEIEKCRRYRLHAERRRYVTGRALLRKGLSQITGRAPKSFHFCLDAACKTHLVDSAEFPTLDFSVAHSGRMVMVAVSKAGKCGVDIERVNSAALKFPIEGIFTEEESKSIAKDSVPLLGKPLFRQWTAKEAYAKYQGLGFHLDFLEFEASFAPTKINYPVKQEDPNAVLQSDEIVLEGETYCWSIVTSKDANAGKPSIDLRKI